MAFAYRLEHEDGTLAEPPTSRRCVRLEGRRPDLSGTKDAARPRRVAESGRSRAGGPEATAHPGRFQVTLNVPVIVGWTVQ
jgi:hypothetical protein